MIIDAFLSPYFPETENLFEDSIVIMIDVLRASTTISAALYNGAKEIIPCDSLDKAVKVYSSLNKEMRFLGGERNGIKPSGFDAGNSPFEYDEVSVKGKSVILSTSNGTKTFMKAKLAYLRIIAGFVNHNSVRDFVFKQVDLLIQEGKDPNIYILCSGTNGRLSYDDILCAGAIIQDLVLQYNVGNLSDPADAAKNLYNLHRKDLKEFLFQRDHARRLIELGYEKDVDLSLTFNVFPVVPVYTENSIKIIKV